MKEYRRMLAAMMPLALCVGLGCSQTSDVVAAKPIQKKIIPNGFPMSLPEFSLQDPHGKTHHAHTLKKLDLVMVVTAPTLANKDAQEGWAEALENLARSKKVNLVFLEDMQTALFKRTARSNMKRESNPREKPILLLDVNGRVRKSLNVAANKTVVMVFKKSGNLVHVETDEPNQEAVLRIKQSLAL